MGQHLDRQKHKTSPLKEQNCLFTPKREQFVAYYHVPAYCDEGSFEEDAELCECACGKAVLLHGPCVLWRNQELNIRAGIYSLAALSAKRLVEASCCMMNA